MKIVILIVLVALSSTLYTSSYWAKLGHNVRDQILEEASPSGIFLQTVCNEIDLSAAPYKHRGLVMTGYLNVQKGGSGLGFIFYGKEGATRQQIANYPIIIWLNGGPGSSSQLGNFMELGPYFLRPATMQPFEIVKNNQTWVRDFNVLFVDQPVGTGLSWADMGHPNVYCQNMSDVAQDFYYALSELYTSQNGCFKKLGLLPSQPLFIFGESYAGKYAPAIAQKIIREQMDNRGFLTGLKGVAIGDGFTHPYDILSQVGEYAFNMGLIDYQERTTIEHIMLNATYQERRRAWRDLHDSFDLSLDLLVQMAGNVNVYDITKYREYPTQIVGSYLQNPDIVKLYKLNPDVKFGNQSSNVYESLYEDFMMQYVHLVEELLSRGVQVLIYNGQNDLIVETPGTFKWVERIHYADANEFRETLFTPWKVGTQTAGYYKSVGKLELRTVNNAGHLVPMDQGEFALDLVNGFVKKSLSS